ncbi:cd7 antigen-like [Nelusetta ayraudi]|uniref:cd7 antigen-like n=1 Tax=Nelusetta ayraudi TaxID=303726 RepID=UPI003F704C96
MTGLQLLVLLWTLLFAHTREARGEVLFLERREGESAVLPCEVEPSTTPPFGVYLKRSWRSPAEVLFVYRDSNFTAAKDEDKARIAVSGDPASLALNVSLSQLRADDTDRYSCEFMVENPSSEDLKLPGKTEFFLLVVGGGSSAGELLSFPHTKKSVELPFSVSSNPLERFHPRRCHTSSQIICAGSGVTPVFTLQSGRQVERYQVCQKPPPPPHTSPTFSHVII